MQDSNGNSWGYGNILRSSFSTILFNSQSQFVQSIPPQSFNSGFVFYSSADGVTNTWLALVTGNFSLAAYDTTAGSIDPYGNFIGGGLLFNSTRHIFYDKNNTLILSNSVLGGNPLRAYLFKYAPSGVWNLIQLDIFFMIKIIR
jgi:hypothetical protein